MAEAEQSDKNVPTPHKKSYHQNRHPPPNRGRGRPNPSVSKALHLFGVRDLREILDRKHQDDEQIRNGPPPDPSYNYLKDPLRENPNQQHAHKYQKEQQSGITSSYVSSRGHSFRGSRGRGRGYNSNRDNRSHESEKVSFIQNPVNIKVQVVASTGERNCKLDEATKIANIKHVPNYKPKDSGSYRNDGGGRSYTDYNSYRNDSGGSDYHRNERGRGRGQRGRRGRGRGGRGEGKPQYSNRNENPEHNQKEKQTVPEVSTDENWDTECVDTPPQNSANEETEAEGSINDNSENQEHHENEYQEEEYYEEGEEEEYSEINEQNSPQDGVSGDNEINVEENLVITSLENEEKRKRTVKFKVDNEETDEAVNNAEENDGKKSLQDDGIDTVVTSSNVEQEKDTSK